MRPASLWRPPWSTKSTSFSPRSENAAISARAAKSGCAKRISCRIRITRASDRAAGARSLEVVKRTEDEFLKAELQELGRRIRDARVGIATFLEQSAEGHVYWVERTGKTAQFLTLNAAPIDIAPVLRADDFSRQLLLRDDQRDPGGGAARSCLFPRPDRRGRGGAVAARKPVRFSPAQMKLFVVRKMPDPRDAGYEKHWHIGLRILSRKQMAAPLFFSPAIAGCSNSPTEMQSFFAKNG